VATLKLRFTDLGKVLAPTPPAVTNATITATAIGAAPVTFANSGSAPDAVAGNSVYSAYVTPPLASNSVVLTVVVSAPGKVTITNTISFGAAPPPR
jgi:hypothetical protein